MKRSVRNKCYTMDDQYDYDLKFEQLLNMNK